MSGILWSSRKGRIAKAREEARLEEELKVAQEKKLAKAGQDLESSLYDLNSEFVEQNRKADEEVLARNQIGVQDNLRRAARYGDEEKLLETLQTGVDLNCKDHLGFTPLMLAAQNGHLECCRALIKGGCEIDSKNRMGQTALMVATAKDKVDSVRLLLANKASRKKQSNKGCTALIIAAGRNSLEALLVLLEGQPRDEHGEGYVSRMVKKDIDRQDKFGRTALHYTCHKDMPEATQRLMQAGANIQSLDHLQDTPLMVAERFGCAKALRVIDDMRQANLAREALARTQGHKDATMKAGKKSEEHKLKVHMQKRQKAAAREATKMKRKKGREKKAKAAPSLLPHLGSGVKVSASAAEVRARTQADEMGRRRSEELWARPSQDLGAGLPKIKPVDLAALDGQRGDRDDFDPKQIEVDQKQQLMYFTDSYNKFVWRADLDGKNFKVDSKFSDKHTAV